MSRPESGLRRRIINGSLQSVGARCVGLGLGFISTVLLSRHLGGSEFGKYSILLSWCLLFVVPIKLGYDHAVLKFAAGYWAEKEYKFFNGMAIFGIRIVVATALATSFAISVIYYIIPGVFSDVTPIDLIPMIFLSTILASIGIFSQFFRAAELIFLSQFFEQIFRSAILIGLILLSSYVGYRMTSGGAILLTAAAATIALGALIATFLYRVWHGSSGVEAGKTTRTEWMSVSWPMLGATLASQALSQMGVIILGIMAASSDAGHFAAIARLAAFVTFALVALNSITAPLIASAFKRGDMEELRRISTINARLSTGFGLAVCLALTFTGTAVLRLFGPEFPAAYPSLLVLMAGTIVGAATGPVGYLLSMTNQQSFFFWNSVVCAILTLALMALAIHFFGAIGAAIGASLGQFYQNFTRWHVVRNRLGIDASFIGLPIRSADPIKR